MRFQRERETGLALYKLSPKMISTASAGGSRGQCRALFGSTIIRLVEPGTPKREVATPQLKRAENPELMVARSLGCFCDEISDFI